MLLVCTVMCSTFSAVRTIFDLPVSVWHFVADSHASVYISILRSSTSVFFRKFSSNCSEHNIHIKQWCAIAKFVLKLSYYACHYKLDQDEIWQECSSHKCEL